MSRSTLTSHNMYEYDYDIVRSSNAIIIFSVGVCVPACTCENVCTCFVPFTFQSPLDLP